jgi:hypothetical protein
MKPTFPFINVKQLPAELRNYLMPVDQTLGRVRDMLDSKLTIADNMNAAIITLSATHGQEVPLANPLTGQPAGFQVIEAHDSNGNPLSVVGSPKLNRSRTDGLLGITVEYVPKQPYAEFRPNGDQNTADNAEVPVSWGTTVLADSAGVISITSNGSAPLSSRITVSEAGVYDFTGQVSWAANATGKRYVFGAANNNGAGATVPIRGYSEVMAVTGDYTALDFAFRWKLSAGGYVEIFALQNSGGALALKGADASYHPAIQVSRYRNDSTPTGIVRGILWGA